MQYETESGTVIGNVENKYDTRNPISQMLMDGFFPPSIIWSNPPVCAARTKSAAAKAISPHA